MTWDQHARQLCLKAVATVETGMRYDVIYYPDAITIGYIQWYAGWACKLLKLLSHLPEYQGLPAQLRADVVAHPSPEGDWDWWTTRYLTKAEGALIKPLMTCAAGIKIQNDLAYADIEEYRGVAMKLGLDANVDTNAFIFWVVMHHQNPRGAKRILNQAGSHPSVDRLYTLAMNDKSFVKYKSRYNKAKAVIESGDPSGVPDGSSGVVAEDDPIGDVDNPDESDGGRIAGVVKYLMVVGDAIHVHMTGGSVLICNPTGTNMYLPPVDSASNGAGPEIIPVPDNNSPEVPSGDGVELMRAGVVKWMTDRLNKFAYSQGAGRMDPDKSGKGDCSSTVYRAYLDVCNIKLGANTRSQYTQGQMVWGTYSGQGNKVGDIPPQSILKPGDLIYVALSSAVVSHVEMYVGGDRTIGHGGGAGGKVPGPHYGSLSWYARKCRNMVVRRHIL